MKLRYGGMKGQGGYQNTSTLGYPNGTLKDFMFSILRMACLRARECPAVSVAVFGELYYTTISTQRNNF